MTRRPSLREVAVVVDVVHAEAVVALAAGAVAELQLRVVRVRPAADLAAAGVWLLLLLLLHAADLVFEVDRVLPLLPRPAEQTPDRVGEEYSFGACVSKDRQMMSHGGAWSTWGCAYRSSGVARVFFVQRASGESKGFEEFRALVEKDAETSYSPTKL